MTSNIDPISYWANTGKHQELAEKLEELVPDEGRVPNPYRNKALERFRKAVNAYCRLYNDGDLHIGAARMFGIEYPSTYRRTRWSGQRSFKTWSPELYVKVNEAMDQIVLAAAEEQGLKEAA